MKNQSLESAGFSLVEILAVLAVISILAVMTVPTLSALQGAAGFGQAAADISGALEQARAYGMSNNTYVYVGLQEVDGLKPTSANGTGCLVVAMIASNSGTRPYGNSPSALSTGVTGVAKPQIFHDTHLTTDAGLSPNGGMANRVPADAAFVDLGSTTAKTSFQWPLLGTANYNFTKVIEFDPQGTARVQTAAAFDPSIPSYIEIPIVPARGNTVPAAIQANQAALQINGITGVVRTYRP